MSEKDTNTVHIPVNDQFHLTEIRASEQLIGVCGFDGVTRGHRAELGYWLAKRYWGQGIMTAVTDAACRHMIDQFELVRLVAYVFPQNVASARVLEKIGFRFEGLLPKHFQKEGRFIDARLYGLVP